MTDAIAPLSAWIYEEHSFGVFLFLTVVLGGAGAWLTGRAVAGVWRPWWQVAIYAAALGGVVRFFHFALFGGTLLSAHYYGVDTLICLLIGLCGFRVRRAEQMSQQYHWLFYRDGPLRWRQKER